MGHGLKIAIIGAGSTYTPELIDGFIRYQDRIPIDTLVFMDLYRWRLETVGSMAQRMLDQAGYPLLIRLTTNRSEALEGADFVITQMRVGGMAARLSDETIPPRYGVIGQETVGPGGIAKALRTIPTMLDIAHDMERWSPQGWMINFTNPSGLISEALWRHSQARVIGLCNLPTNMRLEIAAALNVSPDAVTLDYLGLNHLGFVRGVWVNGEDYTAQALQATMDLLRRERNPVFSPELIQTLGLIPSYYLTYFYHHDRVLAEQRQAPQTRTERVREIEKELLKLYADPKQVEKPALLSERGGAHYSTVAVSLIADMIHNTGATHIVNVPNQSTLPGLPPEAAVEVPCRITAEGAFPLPTEPIPPQIMGLIQAVKASEMLTIEAAVTGDKRIALQALLAHPLVPSFATAQSLLAALLAEHRDYLPQFVSEFVSLEEAQ
jgi:6-phospho-beta-glucosidase